MFEQDIDTQPTSRRKSKSHVHITTAVFDDDDDVSLVFWRLLVLFLLLILDNVGVNDVANDVADINAVLRFFEPLLKVSPIHFADASCNACISIAFVMFKSVYI